MGFKGPLGWEELALNVHEDIIAQPLSFACRRICLVTDFIRIALSTHWGLENKGQVSQAETLKSVLSNSPRFETFEGTLRDYNENCLSAKYTCLTGSAHIQYFYLS